MIGAYNFWVTVCKTVRPMLSVRCPVYLSVCNVGVLWPNGWTDQDETWHAGTSRPWPHCVTGRWGPRSPSPKGAQPRQFSAHICCGQMAAWIKMALAMEAGLGPGDFILDGAQLSLSKRGRAAPPPKKKIPPICIVAKRRDGSRWHLVWR